MSRRIGKVWVLNRLLRGFSLGWMLCISSVALAADVLWLPVIIKGFQLPSTWQTSTHDWQVLTFNNQQWQALTFQLDERDAQGHVITDVQRITRVLHAQDDLLLLWNELSDQPWPDFVKAKKSQNWLELVIVSPVLGQRYAYVFREKKPLLAKPSTQDYVRFDLAKQQVSSEFLQVEYAANDFTQVNAIRVRGQNVLDSVHANFSTGLLYKGLRVELNDQQHIQAKLQGVRDGPIRVALRLNLSIRYAGMTLYDSPLMIHHYPNAVNLPSRFVGSSIKALDRFSWLLKQPTIALRLTLQNVLGAKVTIMDEDGQLHTAQVNGQLSPAEKLLRTVPGRWLAVSTPQWQALLNNTLPPVQGGLLQQYLQGIDVSFWYDEAATTLTVGADVQGLPKNAVQLLALLAQLPPAPGDDLGAWLAQWIALGEAGKLKRVNQLHQQVWQAWLKKLEMKKIISVDQVAHWLMLDFQLTGFVGYDSAALQNVLADALRQTPNWQKLDLLAFFKSLQAVAASKNFDWHEVKYRPLDNTLWFAPAPLLENGKLENANQVNSQWKLKVN